MIKNRATSNSRKQKQAALATHVGIETGEYMYNYTHRFSEKLLGVGAAQGFGSCERVEVV